MVFIPDRSNSVNVSGISFFTVYSDQMELKPTFFDMYILQAQYWNRKLFCVA